MGISEILTSLILEADRPGAMQLIDGWCDKLSINQVVEKAIARYWPPSQPSGKTPGPLISPCLCYQPIHSRCDTEGA
jgi:hypothetical protein